MIGQKDQEEEYHKQFVQNVPEQMLLILVAKPQ